MTRVQNSESALSQITNLRKRRSFDQTISEKFDSRREARTSTHRLQRSCAAIRGPVAGTVPGLLIAGFERSNFQ